MFGNRIFALSVLLILLVTACCPGEGADDQKKGRRLGADEIKALQAFQVRHRSVAGKTAVIDARYLSCGLKSDVSLPRMRAFLREFLPVVRGGQKLDKVEAFVRRKFPGNRKAQLWRNVVLTTHGKKFREYLEEDPRANGFENVQETTADGQHVAMYWKDSGQATIFVQGKQLWSHLRLNSFWRIPGDKVFEYPFTSLGGGKVRADWQGGSLVFDVSRGVMLESESPGRRQSYQCAFKTFDGVLFPTATLDIRYRKGKLYSFDLLVVRSARFARPLTDNFALVVPRGTVIVDARKHPVSDAPAFKTPVPISDVVAWLKQRDPE